MFSWLLIFSHYDSAFSNAITYHPDGQGLFRRTALEKANERVLGNDAQIAGSGDHRPTPLSGSNQQTRQTE
jgi:hypothetical protein